VATGERARVAAALLRFLDDEHSAIAGGMAVNAYGYVRAIRDVDVITALPLTEARRRLREHGVPSRLVGRRLEGVIAAGRGRAEGVPFAVLSSRAPVATARTVELVVRGQPLRLIDADTLVELQLDTPGPHGVHDVAVLVTLHPELEARALAVASARGKRFAERVLKAIRVIRGQRSAARAASRR
jgi:hypothetical protein